MKAMKRRIPEKIRPRTVYQGTKLSAFFSTKDKVPLPLKSGVVYKFTCSVDPKQSYIGKTYRHLGQRIKEHSSKISAIYDHRLNCQCTCNTNNFRVIDTATDNFSLNIKEAIHIKYLQPSLNKNLKDKGSYYNCNIA